MNTQLKLIEKASNLHSLKKVRKYHLNNLPVGAIPVSTQTVSLIQTTGNRKNEHTVNDPDIPFEILANAYKNYWLLKRAIGVRATNVAPRKIQVVDVNPKNKRRVILNHPLTRAFARPNPAMNNMSFNMSYEVDLVIAGEWFSEVKDLANGEIELWHRRPDEIKMKFKNLGSPPGISPRRGLENRTVINKYLVSVNNTSPITVDPKDMIHIKTYNPTNLFRGVGEVQSILNLIYNDSSVQKWIGNLVNNNAIPSYVFIASKAGALREDERSEIEDKLMRLFGGVEKSGRPLVLDSDQQIKPISHTPNELKYLEFSSQNQDSISTAVGVPNELLGLGENTYENLAQAMVYLWELTLLPDVLMRDQYLTEFFRERGNINQYQEIHTDLSSVTFLQKDLTTRLEQAEILIRLGAWSPNQINRELGLNMPFNPSGDTIYIASNLQPIGKVDNEDVSKLYFSKRIEKSITKQLPDDVPEFVLDYENDILDLIDQANNGDIDEDEFKETLTDIVVAFVLLAFLSGSGLSEEDLGKEEIEAIAEESEDALLGIDDLTADVFSGRLGGDSSSQLDTMSRIGLWAGVGLSIYNLGLLFDPNDPLMKWIIDPAKDNCKTCMAQSGKVLRASEWRNSGVWPQGRMLECRGYRCGCRFIPQ